MGGDSDSDFGTVLRFTPGNSKRWRPEKLMRVKFLSGSVGDIRVGTLYPAVMTFAGPRTLP